MDTQSNVDIAIEIAREAGALLRQGYGQRKEITRKSTAVDWVTQYDTAAEKIILQRLETAFPGDRIIAEESGQNHHNGEYVWYIDPLDGTTNFAHSFPVFCVSIARYKGDEPVLGVIYDPLRDECFYGVRGQGAFLQSNGQTTRLQVSGATDMVNSLLATGFPYDRHNSSHDNLAQTRAFLKQVQGVRRAGAAALDMAYVAAGRLDGYWEYKLSSWDIAAGALLVQEAGGVVTEMDGRPFTITPRPSLVASNGRIHPHMLQTISNEP
ncbi:MAG: inositol monophosphatase [Ardenticatenaceae bacterium]|nr:inositol monophosphatase [Ardenticatenaceae bacterium]MCB8989983.1 inositol monophosphatase [Ardenticatenaceae bacterium]